MGALNTLNCGVSGYGNTGFGSCILSFDRIAGAFLVPRSYVLTPANIAALQSKLQTDAQAADPINRIYPIHYFEGITDNSADVTDQTLGYQSLIEVNPGDYNWLFQYIEGGLCLNKALWKLKKGSWSVLFYDKAFKLFGYKSGANLKGVPLKKLNVPKWRPNDGNANVMLTQVGFVFEPSYINEQIGFVDTSDLSIDLTSIVGLQDVALTSLAARAAGVMQIGAITGCGSVNLYNTYGDNLNNVSAWVATNASGALIDITSVGKNANLKGWTITLSTSDADYVSAGPINIQLADPSTLAGAPITMPGYESNKLSVA